MKDCAADGIVRHEAIPIAGRNMTDRGCCGEGCLAMAKKACEMCAAGAKKGCGSCGACADYAPESCNQGRKDCMRLDKYSAKCKEGTYNRHNSDRETIRSAFRTNRQAVSLVVPVFSSYALVIITLIRIILVRMSM
jgi:hypothetical protein